MKSTCLVSGQVNFSFTCPHINITMSCKKRKLALILETGTNLNHHNLTLKFLLTINLNLTRRHAEQAHSKTSHMMYIYRTIKGTTKSSQSKCKSNESRITCPMERNTMPYHLYF